MRCPFCQTENREDRERCYACDKDISMLRLIVNKARHHYNLALEHAERNRLEEAIDELHNALDLDRQFVNAHVVLGTLYAKRNEFDKAQEAWKSALALNPELAKAHQYLERVDSVQEALPAMRIAQIVSIVSGGLCVLLLVGLLFALRPDPTATKLLHAQHAYEQQDFGRATELLEQVVGTGKGSKSLAAASARALKSAIDSDLTRRLWSIQSLASREQYAMALTQVAELEKRKPSKGIIDTADIHRKNIKQFYVAQIEQACEDYHDGALPYNQLSPKVKDFLRLYPDDDQKKQVQASFRQVQESEAQKILQQIQSAYYKSHNAPKALEQLQVLSAQFPNTKAAQTGRVQLAEELAKSLFQHFEQMLNERDFEKAEQELASMREVTPQLRRFVDISNSVELAAQMLTSMQRQAKFDKIEQMIESDECDKAAEAIQALGSDDRLTSVQRELLRCYDAQVQKHEALKDYFALRKQESELLALHMSDQEASRLLGSYDSTFKQMEREPAADKARLTAYATAAAVRLGDQQRAQQLLEKLRQLAESKSYVTTIEKLMKKKP